MVRQEWLRATLFSTSAGRSKHRGDWLVLNGQGRLIDQTAVRDSRSKNANLPS